MLQRSYSYHLPNVAISPTHRNTEARTNSRWHKALAADKTKLDYIARKIGAADASFFLPLNCRSWTCNLSKLLIVFVLA